MAILVQMAQEHFNNVHECVVILPQNVGSGNLLIVDIAISKSDASGMMVWQPGPSDDPTIFNDITNTDLRLISAYTPNSSAGLHTIYLSLSNGPSDVAIVFSEYAGVEAAPLGVVSEGSGTGTAASSGATSTPAEDSCLVHGVVAHSSGGNVAATVDGSGWERVAYLPDGTTRQPIVSSQKFITSAAAQTAAYTFDSSVVWAASVGVFHTIPDWVPPEAPSFPPARAGGG